MSLVNKILVAIATTTPLNSITAFPCCLQQFAYFSRLFNNTSLLIVSAPASDFEANPQSLPSRHSHATINVFSPALVCILHLVKSFLHLAGDARPLTPNLLQSSFSSELTQLEFSIVSTSSRYSAARFRSQKQGTAKLPSLYGDNFLASNSRLTGGNGTSSLSSNAFGLPLRSVKMKRIQMEVKRDPKEGKHAYIETEGPSLWKN